MAVYMETDRVESIADGFERAADVLRMVSKALEAAMMLLKSTAFIGMVGGMAVERYIATIKPQIDDLADYCDEICGDLHTAVQLFINGDEEGASRFY